MAESSNCLPGKKMLSLLWLKALREEEADCKESRQSSQGQDLHLTDWGDPTSHSQAGAAFALSCMVVSRAELQLCFSLSTAAEGRIKEDSMRGSLLFHSEPGSQGRVMHKWKVMDQNLRASPFFVMNRPVTTAYATC